jgi:hypothetical protein
MVMVADGILEGVPLPPGTDDTNLRASLIWLARTLNCIAVGVSGKQT